MPPKASYLDVLTKHLFPTLRTVCPERGEEVFGVIDELGITFAFDYVQDRILFQAHPKTKTITVGTRCLERLWAFAYSHFCSFDALRTEKLRDLRTRKVAFDGNERLEKAAALLSWAITWELQARQLRKPPSDVATWPDGLPHPVANPPKKSDEDVADELFLVALGYILHHELAHLRMKHTGQRGVSSVLQEKDADRAAAEWLLGVGLDESEPRFVKRAFGVAVALMWLAAASIHAGLRQSDTHPPGYDRLFQIISQYVTDDMHPVWAFVATGLEMHLHAEKIEYDLEREATSYKDAANYYCDVLSHQGRERATKADHLN
jgi:hypothetical protein